MGLKEMNVVEVKYKKRFQTEKNLTVFYNADFYESVP